jgi:hypothetical protein
MSGCRQGYGKLEEDARGSRPQLFCESDRAGSCCRAGLKLGSVPTVMVITGHFCCNRGPRAVWFVRAPPALHFIIHPLLLAVCICWNATVLLLPSVEIMNAGHAVKVVGNKGGTH